MSRWEDMNISMTSRKCAQSCQSHRKSQFVAMEKKKQGSVNTVAIATVMSDVQIGRKSNSLKRVRLKNCIKSIVGIKMKMKITLLNCRLLRINFRAVSFGEPWIRCKLHQQSPVEKRWAIKLLMERHRRFQILESDIASSVVALAHTANKLNLGKQIKFMLTNNKIQNTRVELLKIKETRLRTWWCPFVKGDQELRRHQDQ